MTSEPDNKLTEEQEDIYKTVDTVNLQLQTLERFIARRFDEISMEINATSQQFDMAESGITERFSEVLGVLGAISYTGQDGGTSANTGVELEAVIEDTKKAANNILDATDRITECLSDEKGWEKAKTRNEMRTKINNDIQEIIMACTFQDLTGQRIRNTLNNLHSIEERLSSTFESLGIEVENKNDIVDKLVSEASDQGAIDNIFDTDDKKAPASQDDIDSMF